MRCPPAEHRRCAPDGGDQLRRIAGTARTLNGGHRAASDAARCLDDLPHRAARTGAEVDRDGRAVIELHIQRAQVRVGNIGDMHVVPDCGTVSGRIIGAVDLERTAPAERRRQHIRDQLRLRVEVFAGLPYTAHEDDRTKRRTLARTAASNSTRAAVTLLVAYIWGWATDSATSAKAARWIIASMRSRSNTAVTSSRSPTPPWMKPAPRATASRCPRLRSSRTTTVKPRSRS